MPLKLPRCTAHRGRQRRLQISRRDDVALISARTGAGVEALKRLISTRLTATSRVRHVELAASDGASVAWLHAHGEVLAQDSEDEVLQIDVRLSDADWARFLARG